MVWDHRNPPNQRVKSIHLTNAEDDDDDSDDGETAEDMIDFVEQEDGTRVEVKQKKIELGDEVKNEAGGRIYRVVSLSVQSARGDANVQITRDYMAQGYDGFQALKNRKFIIDDETGQIMSSIIRSFLLGKLEDVLRNDPAELTADQAPCTYSAIKSCETPTKHICQNVPIASWLKQEPAPNLVKPSPPNHQPLRRPNRPSS